MNELQIILFEWSDYYRSRQLPVIPERTAIKMLPIMDVNESQMILHLTICRFNALSLVLDSLVKEELMTTDSARLKAIWSEEMKVATWIDKTGITIDEFKRYIRKNNSQLNGTVGNHPFFGDSGVLIEDRFSPKSQPRKQG